MSKVVALLPKEQPGYVQLRVDGEIVLLIKGYAAVSAPKSLGQWEMNISGDGSPGTHIALVWADFIRKGDQ